MLDEQSFNDKLIMGWLMLILSSILYASACTGHQILCDENEWNFSKFIAIWWVSKEQYKCCNIGQFAAYFLFKKEDMR